MGKHERDAQEGQTNTMTRSGKPQTGHWTRIARAARRKAENRCVKCGGVGALEVHHRDGQPLNNTPNNLMPLCHNCHVDVHQCGEDWFWKPITKETPCQKPKQ